MSDTPGAKPLSQPAFPPAQVPRTRRFKTARVVTALILREIAATDSRTSLGFLWAFVEPIATIALLTILFSFLTRNPPLGTNFALFYVTGVVPFQTFTQISNKVAGSLNFSRPLLGFPVVTPLDAIAARFLLQLLIMLVVFAVTTVGIIQFYHLRLVIDLPMVVASMALVALLGLAVGTFNSVLFLIVPTYDNIYSVVTRPLMLLSGVLFLMEDLPAPYGDWLWWNPLIHPINIMRQAFYSNYNPTSTSAAYVILLSLVLFTLGLIMNHRIVRDALE